jgi:HMG (high mobility group) box
VPPNAFILFFQEQLAARPPTSIAETADIARASAERWRTMPPVEQQPFRAAHTAARAQYVEQRAAYWAGVDPNVVRALNAQRRAQGKPRLRAPRSTPTKPLSGYFR